MEELFFSKFKNKESQSSYLYSKEVAQLIKEILKVYFKEQKSVDEILKAIQNLHNSITPHKPTEFSIGNVIKRITSIIREQAKAQGLSSRTEEVEREKQESKPIKLIKTDGGKEADSKEDEADQQISQNARIRFETEVMEAVDGIIAEFENLTEQINLYASKHINNNEIIMVFGSSYTVANLLIEAKKKKTFEVIVVENNLSKNGHNMAKKLKDAQIKTTLIPDTAAYAVMHRVHKAFISAHAFMANGGILGTSGSLLIALACKAHLVPMIVVGGIYKLTPKVPFEQDTYNDLINPGEIFKMTSEEKIENIKVIIPGFDYIAPEYITLYITNLGEHTPAYIYRVFSEYYVKQ